MEKNWRAKMQYVEILVSKFPLFQLTALSATLVPEPKRNVARANWKQIRLAIRWTAQAVNA